MNAIRWLDYDTYRGSPDHTVTGHVVVARNVRSPQLGNRRDILVYLPPSYEGGAERYPVVYMHDGQNLFDETTSFVGEWGVDKIMDRLARTEGLEALVVGIPNMGEERMAEYSPFADPQFGGGRGDAYLQFIGDTVKPLIDRSFRTQPGPSRTATIGSSMGGLISLHAFFARPDIFGNAGAMSPSLLFASRALFSFVRFAPFVPGRLYLDMGAREFEAGARRPWLEPLYRRRTLAPARRMRDLLLRKGYRPGENLMYVEDPEGIHHESAWARRLPGAMTFLLEATVAGTDRAAVGSRRGS